MKRYRVVIPKIVEEQLRAQVMHIARDSVDNALAWEERLRAAIEGIGQLAGGHAVDEDASERIGLTVHKMVHERTYLVHYLVKDDAGVVEIINFRHGARLPGRGEP